MRALLVPDDSPGGYTVFAIELGPDNTFTVPGVPNGSYFLQLDTTYIFIIGVPITVTSTQLIELTADVPDLSLISAARADLTRVTMRTPVTLNVSNLQPWESGNQFLISSSQADAYVRPLAAGLLPPPTPGMTSYSGTFDWNLSSTSPFNPGLPDASKKDVVFLNQRSTLPIGSGDSAAELRYASRYARLTDFTATDGLPSTLTVSLIETQQTGNMRADVRGSQFAALASDVHPTARPNPINMAFSVLAVPHSVDYPDMPNGATSSIFYFQSLTTSTSDFDYGIFTYPQFHDPLWTEFRQLLYSFGVTLLSPGTKTPTDFSNAATVLSWVPMTPAPNEPIAPALGPPTVPLINGTDAFVPHSGVGLQPILSWSPPNLGTASSYRISVRSLSQAQEGDTVSFSAIVYSGTSFKVPAGLLRGGNSYMTVITARAAQWDLLDRAPFWTGTPFHSADCVTGIFIP